jgi:alpha-L-rhamnosidase
VYRPSFAVALVLAFNLTSMARAEEARFLAAQPVWPAGRQTEMNLSVGFRAVVAAPAEGQAVLRVAAASIYRAWLNGEFLGCGPARGPHGYYRIDEWPLAGRLRPGKNLLAIEVAGYNSNSYYLLDQPSFVQAEVTAGPRVLASTAGQGAAFAAVVLDSRVQKVARYSFQRPFSEVYHLTPASDAWRRDVAAAISPVACAVQPGGKLLPRRVLRPDFALRRPLAVVGAGSFEVGPVPRHPWKDRSLTKVGPILKGFPEAELAQVPSVELQRLVRKPTAEKPAGKPADLSLDAGRYTILDLGANQTGFLGLYVTCKTKTRIDLLFDEVLTRGDVDFKRMGCVNVVRYDLEPGTYRLETIEPYTLRYLKLVCETGACQVDRAYLREYGHPPVPARFAAADARLNRLFAAAVNTFRQNTLDIFMDCPSRERAGWLCDSFFTARVAADLTGTTRVEHNFLENFLLPERFAGLPDGMLPMCYPADHYDGVFIPNWAMWFVVELGEYAARGGDPAVVQALRGKVLRLVDYFRQFENSDGLLEKLPSWVFVEWSAANRFVQDVNYPSNMLYAAVLSTAARLYHQPALAAQAERMRDTIRRQSFDGTFFVDNAVRRAGKLAVTRNRTEVCQYFAFYFGVATRQTHAQLWRVLRDEFGPDRAERKAHPEIHAANSFIGNVLRMELLSQDGRGQQILDESIAYLLYMAERTGTLWENVGATASCDHGFASHAVCVLYRDVLGLYQVDRVVKRVQVRLGTQQLAWCEGTLPTADGPLTLRWHRDGSRLSYRLSLPPGWTSTVDNQSGLTLVRE